MARWGWPTRIRGGRRQRLRPLLDRIRVDADQLVAPGGFAGDPAAAIEHVEVLGLPVVLVRGLDVDHQSAGHRRASVDVREQWHAESFTLDWEAEDFGWGRIELERQMESNQAGSSSRKTPLPLFRPVSEFNPCCQNSTD